MKNVLLAVDEEHFGNLIADFVCSHRWHEDTRFRLLSVLPWMPPEKELRVSADLQNYVEKHRSAKRALLDNLTKRLLQGHIKVENIETEILRGNPAELILEIAESWPADMLLIGSHGRKGVGLFLMGSVSSAVVEHAPCSVIVVRPQNKESRPGETMERVKPEAV